MKTVKTIVFIEEIPTDGHSPMKFICNDGQVYFCKYRLTSKIEELDCLIYEVIGHFLLKSLDIPTPDIALVELIERVFTKKDIPRNCKYAKPLTICFGSKEVKNANLISGLESVVDAHQTLCDPYDLLRIAIFDLWVDNADRGKNNNYNLLTSSYENKLKVWAFDHAFIFGGIPKLRIFNPNFQPIIQNNLFTAPYFSTVLRQLNPQKCMEVATQFIDNLVNSTSVLDSAFEQIPENWQVYPILKIKIRNFLLDSQRLKTIEKLTFQYLSKQ